MRGYLLDTHVWIWVVEGSSRLPAHLADLVERNAASCWLSPISLWELDLLAEKGRIRLSLEAGDWAREALKRFPLREAPINFEVVRGGARQPLAHRDPADRFLAATAAVYELTLVTVDERLLAAEWLATAPVEG